MEEPLLSEEKSQPDGKKWRSYESLGRSSSVLPIAPLPTIEVSIDELSSATGIYPPVGSPKPSYLPLNDVHTKDKGPQVGIWELDVRSEFPTVFVPYKEIRLLIPHSKIVKKCLGSEGRGDVICPTSNSGQQRGHYNKNQRFQCGSCCRRGLIAHRDGSDSICTKCDGKGKVPCGTCGSRELIKWESCKGSGSLLSHDIAILKWKTLSTRKVSVTSKAASVPDEVF